MKESVKVRKMQKEIHLQSSHHVSRERAFLYARLHAISNKHTCMCVQSDANS